MGDEMRIGEVFPITEEQPKKKAYKPAYKAMYERMQAKHKAAVIIAVIGWLAFIVSLIF